MLLKRSKNSNIVYSLNNNTNIFEISPKFNRNNIIKKNDFIIFSESEKNELFTNSELGELSQIELKRYDIIEEIISLIYEYKVVDISTNFSITDNCKNDNFYMYYQINYNLNIFLHPIDYNFIKLYDKEIYSFNTKIFKYYTFFQNHLTRKEFPMLSFISNNSEIILVNINIKLYTTPSQFKSYLSEVSEFYNRKYKEEKIKDIKLKYKLKNNSYLLDDTITEEYYNNKIEIDEKVINNKSIFPDIENFNNSDNIFTSFNTTTVEDNPKPLPNKLSEDEEENTVIIKTVVKVKKKKNKK